MNFRPTIACREPGASDTSRKFLCVAAILALFMSFVARNAQAQSTPTVSFLYSFCSEGYPCLTDGQGPYAALVQGSDGNLYSTTSGGGAGGFNAGTVFKITPSGAFTNLYNFCSLSNCADGSFPTAALIQGTDGNFYGTTQNGGANSGGTVFKITPGGSLTTLYSFTPCNALPCGPSIPQAPVIQASDGNFYGTTTQGGTANLGTVFQLTPSGTLTVLHSFCTVQGPAGCTDGYDPIGGLVQGPDGNLYGTTRNGEGNSPGGTVFSITLSGTLTTIYGFCAQTPCTDGEFPLSSLVLGSDGNFYGTTNAGGGGAGIFGTVFQITPSGTLTTLYRFCAEGSPCVSTGDVPSGLALGSDGKFYGTTNSGGPTDSGTIFQITSTGTFNTLYYFCNTSGCGVDPLAPPIQAADGNFYGTTPLGGNVYGSVYKLTVPGLSVSVPNVVGLAQATAESDITAAGLTIGTITQQSSSTVPQGDVISQSPTAGTSVASNSPVTLVISTGTAATLTSIAVTPANSSISAGSSLQFTATGTYSDGSTQNLTSSAAWSSSSTTTATITSQGLATGVTAGTTTIGAASGAITGSTGLTVTASVLPPPATFTDNETVTVSDTETFPDVADNEPLTVTDTVSVKALYSSSVAVNISPPGPVPDGSSVTLTATVTSSNPSAPTPTGTIAFMNGATTLGSATLTRSSATQAVATLMTSVLPPGNDSITASYGGDSNFAASASPAQAITVNPADYMIVANPNTMTLAAGESGSTKITVTPQGFAGTISMNCGTLPAYITCSFNPPGGSLTLSNGATAAQSVTLTLNVAATTGEIPQSRMLAATLILPFGIVAVVPFVSVNRRRFRVLPCVFALALISLISGCGGSASNMSTSTLPPPGSQTVTVTAKGSSPSSTVSHQLQLTITITN